MSQILTYEQFKDLPASEKVTLAQVEPGQRLLLWTLDSGAIYKRQVDWYVIDVKIGDTSLVEASSSSLSPGEWYFDYPTKEVFVRLSDDSDPQDSHMSCIYRLFFSNLPVNLPHDLLETGNPVHYEGLLKGVSKFPFEVDHEDQFGIALEDSGSLDFFNMEGFFDPIFDKLFFEEKSVRLYSWSPLLPVEEKRLIFDGIIEDKDWSASDVGFKVKHFIFKLRAKIPTNNFKGSDGTINENILGTPKRTIFGKVKGVKCQSMDQTFGGVAITGTISGSAGGVTIPGVGTSFLSEVSPDDEILVDVLGNQKTYSISQVNSDAELEVSEEIEASFNGKPASIIPQISLRTKNRIFSVAGHKLREPTTTVIRTIQLNRIEVGSTEDLFVGDIIKVGSINRVIKRIVPGNVIVLTQNLPTDAAPSTTVSRSPITSVYFLTRNMIIDRDWTATNGPDETTIEFTELAEFNATPVRKVVGSVTFSNSSRNVTGTGSEFNELKPRDWIRSDDINHQTWYEILQINGPGDLDLRVAYAGTNNTGNATKKSVEYIGDDSIVSSDCYGKEDSGGKWIKTASDAVLDMLTGAGISNLYTDSFVESKEEAPYILSMVLPLRPGSDAPEITKVIAMINKSVFGSLVARSDFQIAFNILSASREDLEEIKDDDIVDFGIKTRTEIYRKFTGKFQHFDVDRYSEEDGSKTVEPESSFVDYLIGSKQENGEDIYLFDEEAAQTMAETYLFHHSLTQSLVMVQTKLNLTLKNINDKVVVVLDRLYQRYGLPSAQRKVGIISKIARNGDSTDVHISDLGNVFNRTAAIADDSALDFTSATESDKMKNGYVVDDSLEIPDVTSEDEIGTNLIG